MSIVSKLLRDKRETARPRKSLLPGKVNTDLNSNRNKAIQIRILSLVSGDKQVCT